MAPTPGTAAKARLASCRATPFNVLAADFSAIFFSAARFAAISCNVAFCTMRGPCTRCGSFVRIVGLTPLHPTSWHMSRAKSSLGLVRSRSSSTARSSSVSLLVRFLTSLRSSCSSKSAPVAYCGPATTGRGWPKLIDAGPGWRGQGIRAWRAK